VREQSRVLGSRIPALIVLMAGLLMIVAAGAGGSAHPARNRHASPLAVRVLLDVSLGLVAAVVLLVVGVLISALWRERKKKPPAEQQVYQAPPVPWALRVALILGLLLAGAGAVALFRGQPPRHQPSRPPPPATGQLPLDQPPPTGKRSIGGDAAAVAVVTMLGLTTAALLAQRARRRRWAVPPATRAECRPTESAPTGEIDAEDLVTEPDPRRAVVAAYARMERLLAAAGVARRPSDAPFEYLGRIRGALALAGPPATRLTELFERAKFSPARVDPAMQAAAVGALRALIDQVAVPP